LRTWRIGSVAEPGLRYGRCLFSFGCKEAFGLKGDVTFTKKLIFVEDCK
jgi:hypothetical protein